MDVSCVGDIDALPLVVAFVGSSTIRVEYTVTDPVPHPPRWARAAFGKAVCGVVSCMRKVSRGSARWYGCQKTLLCGTHKGELRTACDEPMDLVPVA